MPVRPTRFESLLTALTDVPTTVVLVLAANMVLLIGCLDYLTSFQVTLPAVYFLPGLVVAWRAGSAWGAVFGVAASLTSTMVHFATDEPPADPEAYLWSTAMRWAMFLVIVMLVAAIKGALESQRALARTDALTGVFNRRAFFEEAHREVQLSRRTGDPITIAFFDCDDFKAVNDTHGHAVGDALLRAMAKTLRETVSSAHVVARLGGDEFVVVMPDTDATAAQMMIDRIRLEVKRGGEKAGWPTSFSVGVVTFLRPPESVQEMLSLADKVMYQTKSKRGQQVGYQIVAAQAAGIDRAMPPAIHFTEAMPKEQE